MIDPVIGERVFRTRSSAELLELGLLVSWARAAGLVRVVNGRLVPVKKAAALLERPGELWTALFDAFERAGPAYLPDGSGESFLRPEFPAAYAAMLDALRTADGPLTVTDTATAKTAQLTAAGRRRARMLHGDPEPGDPVYRLTVTLLEVDKPAVWRSLAVPAVMPLARLHEAVQAAMGWQNVHLRSFTVAERTYGPPDADFGVTDSARVRLADLDLTRGLLYTYDFGAGREHAITLEAVEGAEPGRGYPHCSGGDGACPPEDCGGAPGYEHLKAVLADPDDPDHEDMAAWLGLDGAADFDPTAFDTETAQVRLRRLGGIRR